MRSVTTFFSAACVALMVFASFGSARADDTEVFFSQNTTGAAANVMLILDTSGSMDEEVVTQNLYDATATYDGSCNPNSYYYLSATTTKLTCPAANEIPAKYFKCKSAATALSGAKSSSGYYASGSFLRWGKSGSTYSWNKSLAVGSGTDIECSDDAGVDGDGSSTTALWPDRGSSATSTSGVWTTTSGNSWWVKYGSGGPYAIYTGNYINFYQNGKFEYQSKITVMQDAVSSLLGSVANVNVGVMRYDSSGNGGMVIVPVGPVATTATPISSAVNSWSAAGSTPLEETLFESFHYFQGSGVYYGDKSNAGYCTSTYVNAKGATHCATQYVAATKSVASSRSSTDTSKYDSPADKSCQKNYVIFLTDGQPNESSAALDKVIKALPDFATKGGSCIASSPPGGNGGLCLSALARYMYNSDLRSDVKGVQNVSTYFIGFGSDFTSGTNATAYFNYLNDAATAGGGAAYTATSLADLTTVFTQIFSAVQTINTTFTAPAVAVNAFNRTETLDDLYMSVFTPRAAYHWPGNVKKYKLVGGNITDASGALAVDASTGFTKDGTQSYWSSVKDGSDVRLGGAAENIPVATSRNMYTYIGTNPKSGAASVNLTSCSSCQFSTSNTALTTTVLGLGTGDPALATVVAYSRGQDIDDVDSNGNTTEQYKVQDLNDVNNDGNITEWLKAPVMGDPIHAQPAVIIYSKTSTVVYTPTNDGYLHAIDSASGRELWSFIPQEMLPRLKSLYTNDNVTSKDYGLDSSVKVLKYDVNGDGIIDAAANDRVLLYFSTGRSTTASMYYALDVTDPATPRLVWAIDKNTLPDLGQAWSEPTIGRLKINGASQNSQHFVLIMGGGYDPSEDSYDYVASDSLGAHVYIVDAIYGTLLWSAGGKSSSSNLKSNQMDHSIVSPITSLDIDGDGYTDRLYFGDMAGQLWRIDLTNNKSVSNTGAGGVIASLGAHEASTHPKPEPNNRRFYSAPDVAEVRLKGITPYLNVAIGSGYRGHPLDDSVQDRLYGIRDYNGFSPMTQTQFNTFYSSSLIKDSALTTVDTTTSAAAGAPGYKILLSQSSGTWIGEKSVTPARTNSGVVYYTTYTPNSSTTTGDDCAGVGSGTNRVYSVSLASGLIVTTNDLAQGGIASEVTFTETMVNITKDGDGNEVVTDCTGSNCLVQEVIFSGQEKVGTINSQQLYKTYWHDATAN